MSKFIRPIWLFLIAFFLTACQTTTSQHDWPVDLPKRQIFVDAFHQKRGVKKVEERIIKEHLSWIIRFYQGTVIYPNGWNKVADLFANSIKNPKERKAMEQRLQVLGIDIANEWAQPNSVRNINSSNMIVWGSALRTAAERNDQQAFVSKVEADVEALIARKLSTKDISYERYYSDDDFDDF